MDICTFLHFRLHYLQGKRFVGYPMALCMPDFCRKGKRIGLIASRLIPLPLYKLLIIICLQPLRIDALLHQLLYPHTGMLLVGGIGHTKPMLACFEQLHTASTLINHAANCAGQ